MDVFCAAQFYPIRDELYLFDGEDFTKSCSSSYLFFLKSSASEKKVRSGMLSRKRQGKIAL